MAAKKKPDKMAARTSAIADAHGLASFRSAYFTALGPERRVEAERHLAELTAPLRMLSRIVDLATGVLRGDHGAGSAFRAAILDIQGRVAVAGSVAAMRSRAREIPNPDGGLGPPCGFLGGGALLPAYMASTIAFDTQHDRTLALDSVAALSLAHGHFEVLYGALVHGGLGGLGEAAEWRETLARIAPSAGPLGADAAYGYIPHPEPPGGPGGGHVPGVPDLLPPRPRPPLPRPDPCELLREACEAMFTEAWERDAGTPPVPPSRLTWADNITSIEAAALCAGDQVVIHGLGFGDPKPENVELVMNVNGTCVAVATDAWTRL